MRSTIDAGSVRSANRELLNELFPQVSVSRSERGGRFLVRNSESGEPTLQMVQPGGEVFWVHSRFNPRAEGEKLAAHWDRGKGLYIMLGFGLGYHVDALIRRIPTESRVLVAEPDLELFALALESVPLSRILQYPNLSLAVGTELSLVYELQRINVTTTPLEPRICVHPTLARVAPDQYQRWQNAIRSEYNRSLLDAATTIRWDLTWGKNTMQNLPRMLASHPVKPLFDRFKGIPGIVVAAGPSLDLNADVLKLAEGRAVIIAVGTALKALQDHGVRPDLVTSYDGGEANYRHFEGVAYDDIPLVYDPMIYPAIPGEHRGQQWVMETTSNPFMVWLRELLGSPGLIASGGSIATVALDLAVKLGCNPLILVGQDLAYRAGHTHARGTVYEDTQVQEAELQEGLHYLKVPSVGGGTVWTSRSWYGFLTWFERYIATAPSDLRFIDATEGGALIHGTEVVRLRDAIGDHCRREVRVREILDSACRQSRGSSTSPEEVRRYLERGVDALKEIGRVAARAAVRAEEAERLVKLGRGDGSRMRRILKALDEADRFLRELDRSLYGLIEMPAHRSALRVVRAAHRRSASESTTDVPAPETVLQQSKELYQGVARAAERTAEVIGAGLRHLGAGPAADWPPPKEEGERAVAP